MDKILLDDADVRAFERNQVRASRLNRSGVIWAALPDELSQQALDLEALRFNQAFAVRGEWFSFEPGCFGKVAAVNLQLDHDENHIVATTKDALTVIADDEAVRCRVDLRKTKNAAMLAHMVQQDDRSSVSIGCDILEAHDEQIDGRKVRVVEKARLREVSLVRNGAVPSAFAGVVDKRFTPAPAAGKQSTTMSLYARLHALKPAIEDLKTEAASPQPAKRAYTLDDCNRWTTEHYEALAKKARSK